MRKISLLTALLLAVVLLSAPFACAKGELSLSGALQPARTQAILAPFSGTLLVRAVEAGDLAPAAALLFELDTTRVYAPCDGVVAGLRAQAGDSIADVSALYGAPLYVEPSALYVIAATTAGAYDDNDNRYIHVGERVYLTSTNNTSRTGEGLVTWVSGSDYTVEVQSGNLRLNENCRVSRDPDANAGKGRIGSGKTERNDPVAVTAQGSVLRLHAGEGSQVAKGDLLMEVVAGDLIGKALMGPQVLATADYIIESVPVRVGDAVQEGQVLATAFPAGTLEAVVLADESDLLELAIGDSVTIELDCTAGETTFKGTVRAIAHTTSAESPGASYEVRVSFANDDFVRQGMSVTVRKTA